MPDVTTRAGLLKPLGTEARSVTPLNSNFDQIDKQLGCYLVNDGVTPSGADRVDGMIVRERTSGIIYEYRKNTGSGLYEKKYIRYPFRVEATSNAHSVVSDTSFTQYNLENLITAENINGTSLTSGRITIPIKGLYVVRARAQFDSDATNLRGLCLNINGTDQVHFTVVAPGYVASGYGTLLSVSGDILLDVGENIGINVWQNSGTTMTNVVLRLSASMIEPIN